MYRTSNRLTAIAGTCICTIAMSIEVIWPGRVRDYYGPGANRRDVIASINNYNHNWQTSFVFADDARPILPAGTQ